MPLTKDTGRQWPIMAEVTVNWDDLVDAAVTDAIEIPNNSTVVGGGVIVDTVFDSVTSDSLDVGDSVDPNRYSASVVDLQALGYTALDLTGLKYTVGDDVTVEMNGVGGSLSAGSFRLQVWYMTEGRAHETMPTRS